LCFDYGLELDEDVRIWTSWKCSIEPKFRDPRQTELTAPEELPHKLKIEVPANRYDLLCHEGLARALRIFLGKQEHPKYRTLEWKEGGWTIKIQEAVSFSFLVASCASFE
jgi:phenylalanyl-tRNA synthetase beta chain